MATGQFITLEGGEGTGKSTQATLLREALEARGLKVIQTREPGGSRDAEAIRTLLLTGGDGQWDPVTETLLQFAARADHLRRTILPALERGTWVVSDRFADSTRAYQGAGLGVDADAIEQIYRLVMGNFRPDLTIVLDLPVATGLARAAERDGGITAHYERMPEIFHEHVRERFQEIAAAEPRRCTLVDADKGIDELHAIVLDTVSANLDQRSAHG